MKSRLIFNKSNKTIGMHLIYSSRVFGACLQKTRLLFIRIGNRRGCSHIKGSPSASHLKSHYALVKNVYDNDEINIFSGIDYNSQLFSNMLSFFGITRNNNNTIITNINNAQDKQINNSVLVDLGGGTGQISEEFHRSCGNMNVLCVDNSTEMLEIASKRKGVNVMALDALQFSKLDYVSYKYILLRFMIHHIPKADLIPIFQGIHRQLETEPKGRMLIMTRHVDTLLPFSEHIKSIWRTTQPDYKIFMHAAIAAGFSKVSVEKHEYAFKVRRVDWYNFIRARTWSVFSMCSDIEIEESIKELEGKYEYEHMKEEFEFTDVCISIVAEK